MAYRDAKRDGTSAQLHGQAVMNLCLYACYELNGPYEGWARRDNGPKEA